MPRIHRVVVTGIGAVSSIGIGKDSFSNAIKESRSGVSSLEIIDTNGFETHVGCEIKNFKSKDWVDLELEDIGRASQFAVVGSVLALKDARIDKKNLFGNVLVCIGTTEGEALSVVNASRCLSQQKSIPLHYMNQLTANLLSINVLKKMGLKGKPVTISTACSAGNYAIGYAFDNISRGLCQYALCGGAESISRKAFAGFSRLGTISPEKCSPFDKNRKGILTGEGAGILLLESLESAKRRRAHIYAEVIGYAINCDARHPVAPTQDRIEECMIKALKNANIQPNEVDYISCHGTGTIANDRTEVAAIKSVFGDNPPPVSSLKSLIGHSMGAASALSCIACILAIEENFIPPTINYETFDEDCQIDCTPNIIRAARLNIVQNNSFAFGGNNAILLLKRYGNE